MKRTPAKVFMTFAVMLMGLLGFQAGANAVPMTPVEPAAITAPAPEALTSQYILNKYVQKVHHRCWRKRVRTLKYCCGFDYYGACIKTCFKYGYKRVCKRHKRYYRKRRAPSYY